MSTNKEQGRNFKPTLNLPQTDFPMRANLVEREPIRLQSWEDSGLYQQINEARKKANATKFILHDGPPFANGDVHMGTALNKILKDFVIKSKTMAGFQAPFVPGWDCHGLPIEFKVVKESRGLEPSEIRKRSEAYARKYVDVQRNSFRRLGVLGDWDDPYLTLAPTYEADIIRTFAAFVDQDLVYQSKKPVLWSFGAQTALAEAEVEYADRTDPAVFVKFPISSGPLAGKSSIVIWTTTPWTLPANLAIALHPQLDYAYGKFTQAESGRTENLMVAQELLSSFQELTGFKPTGSLHSISGSKLEGTATAHPFFDRKSQVILANFVTTETGTGAVHIAPGHGSDDYAVGQQYDLDILSPVDDDGKFTDEVGLSELTGQHVFKSNNRIIEILEESGHLVGRQEYIHSYPHCWRSKTPIIFRAVPQFFVRIDELRPTALKEIENVTWLPHWGRNRIYGTVESRPDWCISRQRTWGVPLPVFYPPDGSTLIDSTLARKVADLVESQGTNLWFEKDDPWWATQLHLPEGTTRCHDTLDVWIDSGSSSVAVLDRHPELHTPADLYLEATDQHRGWFQSSLMLSVAVRNQAPYKAVLTHGFVVDQDRKKISKSAAEKAGKPVDAEHFYNKYGADMVRLWVSSVDWQNEVPFGEELFKQTSETYRRLRNTLRILIGNLYDFDATKQEAPSSDLTLVDRWILERLHDVTCECLAAYETYEFRKVFNVINQFCTVDLSALYIDITKDRMYCDAVNARRRRATQTVMARTLDTLCRLLAPIIAFTADEAWEFTGHTTSIHLEDFPSPDPEYRGNEATERVELLSQLRDATQVEIDQAIKDGKFRKRERATVDFQLPESHPAASLLAPECLEETVEFLMVSRITTTDGSRDDSLKISVAETKDPECPRCRRSLPVGNDPEEPDLCDRCARVLRELTSGTPAK
ncbi:MAG: isoleucine--tRNA ligase [Verrucomicrobiota bacterium]